MHIYIGHTFKNVMKLMLVLSIVGLGSVFLSQAARAADVEPQFFTTLQDVPLMPGLIELEDQAMLFDKPEGKIVEAVALMDTVSEEQVLHFYKASLPQMGWGKTSGHSFFRKDEHLEIKFEDAEDGQPLVKIMVKPAL